MSGKHWTEDELTAWERYFREGGGMPSGRSLEAALRKINPRPRIADLRRPDYHAMACAVLPLLHDVPYLGAGKHTEFVERAQRCAVEPWRMASGESEIFSRAVAAARQALRAREAVAA